MSSVLIAWRSLTQARAFAIAAILTVAIGLGATVSVFTILNALLIRPLPYPEPDRLMDAWFALPGMHFDRGPQSLATYFAFKRFAKTIDGIAVYDRASVNLSESNDRAAPERVRAALVSASLFPMLGATFQLGRAFTPAEDTPRGDPVVVIGDGLWRHRFGADRSVVGRRIQVDGRLTEIIGVLAPTFHFPDPVTELWLPIVLDPNAQFAGPFAHQGFVRLRAGIDRAAAERELNALLPRSAELFPSVAPGFATSAFLEQTRARAFLRPMRDDVVGSFGSVLGLAAGASLLLLLISCANVASLLITRNDARRKEVGICIALGAGTRQILTRLLGEVVILAAVGGAMGLLLADFGVQAFVRAGPTGIPRLAEVSLDATVVAFAIATSLGVATLCGVAPALRYRGDGVTQFLRDGGRGGTTGRDRQRLRRGLVVTQVAFAVVLVTGAGALLRTVARLREVRPGFDVSHELTFWMSLPRASYPKDSDVVRFTEAFLDRIVVAPGVHAVGIASKLPLNSVGTSHTPIWTDNDQAPSGALPPSQQVTTASGGYFAALGIPLLAGRTFNHADRQPAYEAIVDRSLASEYWHDSTGQRVIGRTIRLVPSGGPSYTIVGVVGATRDTSLAAPPSGIVYLPDVVPPDSNQSTVTRTLGVVVQSAGDPFSIVGVAEGTLLSLTPDLPLFNLSPMTDVIGQSMARVSFVVVVLGVAAIAALALAAIGLYGVLAYMVRLDTKEIGVRMAVGASPFSIGARITRRGATLTIIGIGGGLVLFAVLARLVRGRVFGIDLMDPMSMGATAGCLLIVAILASWIPARRAAQVDPVRALSGE
jgi:putative ABC transport system permease protein